MTTGLWNHHPDAKSASFVAPYEEGGETKYAGKPVFIVGGSSSIGQHGALFPVPLLPHVLQSHTLEPSAHTAIQVAGLSKSSPIIATTSMRNDALLKVFGTIHVISNSLPTSTIAAEVEKIAGGKPVELVYDAISLPGTQALAYEVFALGDALLLTRAPQIPEDNKQADDNNKIVNVFGNV